MIGQVLEEALEPVFRSFAIENGLYLDVKGPRRARKGRKVRWVDAYGNSHDLDFVLERNGSESHIGVPVAFIETAWRRYTKHSRNKAQEIQGAIIPLVERYKRSVPFIGVILAGDFTAGALNQLRSQGFGVVHFPYDAVTTAFDTVGIDARFDEQTPDADVERKARAWRGLTADTRARVAHELMRARGMDLEAFLSSLSAAARRQIEAVMVLPLHGTAQELHTIAEAIIFVQAYDCIEVSDPVVKYEIEVRFTNGSRHMAILQTKAEAIAFLHDYSPPRPSVP